MNDPIVEEIRTYRNEHAKRFNYNLDAICNDFKLDQQKYADRLVKLKPRKIINKSLQKNAI